MVRVTCVVRCMGDRVGSLVFSITWLINGSRFIAIAMIINPWFGVIGSPEGKAISL